jgi:kinesin family protein 15
METVYDLFSPNSSSRVNLREDRDKNVYCEPCTEERITGMDDLIRVLSTGMSNRHMASTNMNRESSRSHAIFTATIKNITTNTDNEQIIKSSRFHIIDLAGSERIKDTGATGERLKEAGAINQSLTTLASVIYALSNASENQMATK